MPDGLASLGRAARTGDGRSNGYELRLSMNGRFAPERSLDFGMALLFHVASS